MGNVNVEGVAIKRLPSGGVLVTVDLYEEDEGFRSYRWRDACRLTAAEWGAIVKEVGE